MSDPLASDEDRHATMELQLDHLARRRVEVVPKVADQAAGLIALASSLSVADPSRSLDTSVGAHVVDQGDEAVVEDGEVAA